MSVKNGAQTLDKSIQSILNQSFQDLEFIICDDGSTDDTLNVLQSYSQKDSRVKILHNNESQGLAYSLNRCIEESKSNILARQDADDYSSLNRFEKQLPFVLAHPEYAIIGTGYYAVTYEGTVMSEHHSLQEPTARDQVKGGTFLHPSFMMRKDMIGKVGYYTVSPYTLRSQDYHMVMKVLGAGMKLYNMYDCLYYYTVDEGMKNRTRNWKRVKGLMWIRWDAYRRNKLPFWCYIYVLKPVLTNLIPKRIMFWHYNKVFSK